MASPSVHTNIKPLEWIIGKWVSFEADGQYPTMKNFKFIDILQFESFGHPSITYAGDSIHADSGNPIHAERGFITIKPGTNGIAFIIALISGNVLLTSIFKDESSYFMSLFPTGTTLVETGTIENQKITLESTCIGRSLYFRPEFPNVVKVTVHIFVKLE